jgi:hypothetical protein
MSRLLLTEQLISEVRSLLDETNRARVSDELDIIPALNRGLDHGASIMSKHFDDPLLKLITVTAIDNEINIPADAFEGKIEKVELKRDSGFYEVDRIRTRDMNKFETMYADNTLPLRWAQVGNKIRILPKNIAGATLRIHYLKTPMSLGKTMGRVTRVGSDFLVVDGLSTEVTTNADLNSSYINIVNPMSGDVKGSLQVKRINGDRLEFRSTPDKSSLLGQDIVSLADITVEEEDRLALSGTSCTPFMPRPFSNFLISFAEGEIRRKFGEANELQVRATAELRKDVERSWVGRENTLRIDTRGGQWNKPFRMRHTRYRR